MKITKIELFNFRKYVKKTLFFEKGINVICGDNASGKTSILEAIHFLICCRSMKNNKDIDVVYNGAEESGVFGVFEGKNNKKNAKVLISKYFKKISLNNTFIKKVTDYMGFAKVVSFEINDIYTVCSSPQNRRKMFDFMICQLDNEYLNNLKRYRTLIKEKNSLLKKSSPDIKIDFVLLDVLDKEIFALSIKINKARIRFVQTLNELLNSIHNTISEQVEDANVTIRQSLPYGSSYDDYLSFRKDEMRNQICLVGPHRDDFALNINGKNINKFASQGQIKTFVVSLKLAYGLLIERTCGIVPIILLDDLFGELDPTRQNAIIKMLNKETQTFVTTPSLSDINDEILKKANIIHLEKEE